MSGPRPVTDWLCLRSFLLRAFSSSCLHQVAATQRCPAQCPVRCPKTPPTCAPGVRAVLDDCSCCLVCARQRGESCSLLEPCEESRGLFCDRRADPSAGTGICMGNPAPCASCPLFPQAAFSSPPLPRGWRANNNNGDGAVGDVCGALTVRQVWSGAGRGAGACGFGEPPEAREETCPQR